LSGEQKNRHGMAEMAPHLWVEFVVALMLRASFKLYTQAK
jgi:hypothetical protein